MASDTPPGLQPHGSSLHRSSSRRDSPKALPAPEKSAGRVLITVEEQPAGCADVGATAPGLVDALPQPEHSWLVNAGGTATARRPADAAWPSRLIRNAAQPASAMD